MSVVIFFVENSTREGIKIDSTLKGNLGYV